MCCTITLILCLFLVLKVVRQKIKIKNLEQESKQLSDLLRQEATKLDFQIDLRHQWAERAREYKEELSKVQSDHERLLNNIQNLLTPSKN